MSIKIGPVPACASQGVRVWLWSAVLWMPLLSGVAFAQTAQTWVSAVGNDANPCERTAPCLTFAGALAKTAAGGVINVVDPGAFGLQTLTINKSVTIDGSPHRTSAVNGFLDTDSIVIDAPPQATVTLRNLSLNGFGRARHGIRLVSPAQVVLDRVDIAGYKESCLQVDASAAQAQVAVSRSVLSQCDVGVANLADAAVQLLDDTTVSFQKTASVQTAQAGSVVAASGGSFVEGQTLVTPQSGMEMGELTPIDVGPAVAISGGTAGCAIASEQFLAAANVPALPPGALGVAGPGVDFRTTQCGSGATVVVTLGYASPLHADTVLQKYVAGTSSWQVVPGADISLDRMGVSYQVTDNGPLDDDNTPGIIHDPAWPLIMAAGPAAAPAPIPAVSHWGLALLALLMGALSMGMKRQRP